MRKFLTEYSLSKSGWLKKRIKNVYRKTIAFHRERQWNKFLKKNPVYLDESKINQDSMPVFINNYNRLSTLKIQVEWLLSLKDPVSIIIVDNKSCYPPLLDYYTSLQQYLNVQVVYVNYNSWLLGVYYLAGQLAHFDKLIITDSDVIPFCTTPDDVIPTLSSLLDQFPDYNHVGLSLEINDIPDHYPLRDLVIFHELQFWPPRLPKLPGNVVAAAVDSTFAMYRGNSNFKLYAPALRTLRPYTLQHSDWYLNPDKLPEEYGYYLNKCQSIATWTHQFIVSREPTTSDRKFKMQPEVN